MTVVLMGSPQRLALWGCCFHTLAGLPPESCANHDMGFSLKDEAEATVRINNMKQIATLLPIKIEERNCCPQRIFFESSRRGVDKVTRIWTVRKTKVIDG